MLGRDWERHLSHCPLHPARENLQQDNPCRSPIPAGTLCLTPNTLGCALRKPRVWNAVLAGAGAREPEASWAARGSVAGITSVMILTLPASVTVVAAMAWEPAREAEGIPRCLPPPLPPRHGPFAVRNPREVPAGQGHAPAALCSLREARSWNSRQAPLAQRGGFANGGSQNPAGEEGGREGQGTPPWALQPWEELDAFPLECSLPAAGESFPSQIVDALLGNHSCN